MYTEEYFWDYIQPFQLTYGMKTTKWDLIFLYQYDTLSTELQLCFYWIKKHQPPFERIRHLWGCLGFLSEAIQVLSDDSAHEVPNISTNFMG